MSPGIRMRFLWVALLLQRQLVRPLVIGPQQHQLSSSHQRFSRRQFAPENGEASWSRRGRGRRRPLGGLALLGSTAANEEKRALKAAENAEREAAEWAVILEALAAYKERFGDLRVPTRFKVPAESDWPRSTHDLKLGAKVAAMRGSGKYVSDDDRRRTLDEMGFEWRLRRLRQLEPTVYEPFETLVNALETYRALNDKEDVPKTFVVPRLEDWPASCQGFPLGARIQAIKTYQRRAEPHPYFDPANVPEDVIETRMAQLVELGIKLKKRRASPSTSSSSSAADSSSKTKAAAKAAADENKTTSKKKSAKSSDNDSSLTDQPKADRTSGAWSTLIEAIKTFKEVNGHVRVPQQFVVPDEDPWPENCRNLTLGVRVSKMRLTGTYVRDRPERRMALLDLGVDLPYLLAQPEDDELLAATTTALGSSRQQEDDDLLIDEPSSSQRTSIAIPLSADLNDEDVLSPVDAAFYAEHGWNLDDFEGDYDFSDVIDALLQYKERYGDFEVPVDFVIASAPLEDEHDDYVDEEDDGLTVRSAADTVGGGGVDDLNAALASLLSEDKPQSDEPSVEDLLRLEAEEDLLLSEAVDDIPLEEQIPWPPRMDGLKLGMVVAAMRVGDIPARDDPERKKRLDEIGFTWGDSPEQYLEGINWHYYLACLFSYSKIKGSLTIPWDYQIPMEEPWSLPLRGANFGYMTNKVREQELKIRTHYPLRARLLDSMGFFWLPPVFDPPPMRRDNRLPPCLRLADSELEITRAGRKRKGTTSAKNLTPKDFNPPDPGTPDAPVDYAKYTIPHLKAILRHRNLKSTATRKQEYVTRLQEYDLQQYQRNQQHAQTN